ncbi:FHA domain-containing protein [Aerosticca soli]|uniref:YscD cytoplasmic domain-containing protein n=1 Tax=Aerosticca soli TaxID=2010829 RepID=A0A2Z6E3J6_9GAMM|nr:FHA domain-containing protein [Aerosticca soli]MDI3260460.1 FHA domain-containing protein [Nevskiaceae bacterium]BBD79118.1 hypothetical protein ALSL_0447 [Aerosticca soli]
MRIAFPHSDREDFAWTQPQVCIGTAADNDLVIAAAQVAPRHLCLRRDRRGLVLEVQRGAGRVYVNARPVRERALLRAGDIISVGECRLLLRTASPVAERVPEKLPAEARDTIAVRALAGPLYGRVLAVRERLALGPHGRLPLELPQGGAATLVFVWRDGAVWLEAEGLPAAHPLRVNGWPVDPPLPLEAGDQIGLAMHRLVLDVPWPREAAEPAAAPARLPLPEDEAGPRGEVWWLIVTAAVLALGIALMLFLRFGSAH